MKEKDLQAQCEKLLRMCGYRPRTPDEIDTEHKNSLASGSGFRGWYIHLYNTRKNPLLLDILVLDTKRNRWMEVELKVGRAITTEHQGKIIAIHATMPELLGCSVVCRDVYKFTMILNRFMEGK